MVKYKKIAAPSLTELFVKEIENMIFSGKLKPGERLPAERDMAKSMEISQTIVNNGFSILAGKGLLKIVPRKGTFVNDYKNEGGLETLAALVNYSQSHMPKETVYSMYELRFLLEKTVFTNACKNFTDEDLSYLKNEYDIFLKISDIDEKCDKLYDIVRFVHKQYHNSVYMMIVKGFYPMYIQSFKLLFESSKNEEYYKYVDAIYQSIFSKNDLNIEKEIIDMQNFELRVLEENHFFTYTKE